MPRQSVESQEDGYDPWYPLPWDIRQILLKHGINPSVDLVEALEECARDYASECENNVLLEISERD